MLKITVHAETEGATIELEGQLAGLWVEELQRCWDNVAGPQRRSVPVDLSGVTFIDCAGKTLLARLWKDGAQLRAAGCLTKCIVEDITKGDQTGCRGPRKDQP